MMNIMKKILLATALLSLAFVAPVLADEYDHHRDQDNRGYHDAPRDGHRYDAPNRDYDHHNYGYDHGHDRFSRSYGRHELHDYHMWIFDFPPPIWLAVDPYHQVWCRDYNISTVYVNEFGIEYTVVETHIECMDSFGIWHLVR